MDRQIRILVVEDEERWQEVLCETLRQDNFYVDTASNLADAKNFLTNGFYHLLILDIRLDDEDAQNEQGMEILRFLKEKKIIKSLAVIVLSGHASRGHMRKAFSEYGVVDFLDKIDFDNIEFLKQIRQILTEKMLSNQKLIIHWQNVKGPEQIVLNLDVDGTRVKQNTEQHKRISNELEDLLCRLFHTADSILVRPLALGSSGTAVLWVQPFYVSGAGNAVIVKFGDIPAIEQEETNFRKYVQPFIGGGRNTAIHDKPQYTALLGGIIYSLLGVATDIVEDFGSFYKHASIAEIKDVIDRLFFGTCRAWYANLGLLKPVNLTEAYQGYFDLTKERFDRVMNELNKSVHPTTVQGKDRLIFKAIGQKRSFTNPIEVALTKTFIWPIYVCTTHGDFNEHNILIDRAGHSWLIDFRSTSPGPVLRDVAQLDTAIRLHLLVEQDATLEERLGMEELLCSVNQFSQVETLLPCLSEKNAALLKTFTIAVHLRLVAHKLLGQKADEDMSAYYAILFYQALNLLRFKSLPRIQREHAFISASLLADCLGL
jgi:DNA-binding response OmpR family regulator